MFERNCKNKLYSVYILTLPKDVSGYKNDKSYVGVTSQPLNRRWRNGEGYLQGRNFSAEIKKFGWNNIRKTVFKDNISQDEAFEIEQLLIFSLRTTNEQYGYNMSLGGKAGTYGVHPSDIIREKMSEKSKLRWKDSEYREKTLRETIFKPENKKKASERSSVLSKQRWENPEFREKMMEIFHRPKPWLKSREYHNTIPVVCLNNGETYDAICDAEEAHRCKYGKSINIGKAINGLTMSAGKNEKGEKLLWVTKEEYEKLTPAEISHRMEKYCYKGWIVNVDEKLLFPKITLLDIYYNNSNMHSNVRAAIKNGTNKSHGYYWMTFIDYINRNNLTATEALNDLTTISNGGVL